MYKNQEIKVRDVKKAKRGAWEEFTTKGNEIIERRK